MIFELGMDIVEVERIRKALRNESFKTRVYTPTEIIYCESCSDPALPYAARFAAKEAVAKALGTGIGAQCGINEIEVIKEKSGEPRLLLHAKAAITAQYKGINSWKITLTHSQTSAAATAIGFHQE